MTCPPVQHKRTATSPHTQLVFALNLPRVLSSLLTHLPWPDFLSLLNTCSHCRNIFLEPNLRDTILAQFVPGYANALRFRDLTNYRDLPVSIHDLDLLLISNRIPLHRYPTHALQLLTALNPTLEENYITAKLICLSDAHSRFVLLLQALVHSSSSPVPPEQDDFRRKSHRLSGLVNQSNSEPLEFPAPLAYLKERAAHNDPIFDSTSGAKGTKRYIKNRSEDISRPSAVGSLPTITISKVQESRLSRQALKKTPSRSIFRKAHITPPLPETEPHALRLYSSYRRKNSDRRNSAYNNNRVSRALSVNDFASMPFQDPKLSAPPSSRDSSAPPSPMTSSSFLPRSRAGGSSTAGHPSPSSSSSHSSIDTASPHDLHLSTSRVRAPVLRVFVPCTIMEIDSESVLLCERQLVDAGLWQHLSTGDIICNFGYIPPTPEDASAASTEEGDSACAASRSPSGWNFGSQSVHNNFRKWLLFDGNTLVPYTAPNLSPIENPICLPSPYYYAHLLPKIVPFDNASHFRFWIGKFPPVKHEIPQLTMINVSNRVRSAKSANGWVEVRRWVWTARFVRCRSMVSMDPADEIGAGWLGEWVLEGMGTSEGRQMLLDILSDGIVPGGPREWELVRERSGGGKIWLRLLT